MFIPDFVKVDRLVQQLKGGVMTVSREAASFPYPFCCILFSDHIPKVMQF
jgi:hypothetical protein